MGICCIKECVRPSGAADMCGAHYNRLKRHGSPMKTHRVYRGRVEDRFWSYVRKTSTCWLWTGAKSHGYGQFGLPKDEVGKRRSVQAHRFAYELLVGPVPEGLVLDHLAEVCGNKACVKVIPDKSGPAHLEAVPHRVNVQRAFAEYQPESICRNGHIYSAGNTYVSPQGIRQCRACGRDAMARYRLRQAGKR